MRISDNYFFNTFKQRQQSGLSNMTTVSNQLASGRKIQDSFNDSSIFTDVMRLDYEENTMEQVKTATTRSQTFLQTTDTILADFTSSLDQFKQKLIQANNQSNSEINLNAIAKDLEGMRGHLLSLANSSVNGQFIFGGSSINTKPMTESGKYIGNDQSMNTVIGYGVELPYNIDGESLFLGRDTDYNKIISTNVAMLNQSKLYPANENELSEEKYLSPSDTIMDIFGETDEDDTNNPTAIFYLDGRKPNGETFSVKFEEQSDVSLETLLEDIGAIYGNTDLNKYVDVQFNNNGQIEIKDLKNGNTLIDFTMIAALDRTAGANSIGNAYQLDKKDLLKQTNVDIVTFSKSPDIHRNKIIDTVSSNKLFHSDNIYKVNDVMRHRDSEVAEAMDKIQDVLGSDVAQIRISGLGTDASNTAVGPTTLTVNSTTTFYDLIQDIETTFPDTTAKIENGQIMLYDNSGNDTGGVQIKLEALDNTATAINAFSGPDGFVSNENYFDKSTNRLTSNVSQYVKDTGAYATNTTKIIDVAGANPSPDETMDGKTLSLELTDINGVSKTATVSFNTSGSTFTVGGTTYDILNPDGSVVDADEMTYQQLNDVVSMLLSDSLPTDSDTSGTIELNEYKNALTNAKNNVLVTLDYRGRLQAEDLFKKNSSSQIELAIYDSTPRYQTYADATAYLEGEIVQYNGQLYQADADGTSNNPNPTLSTTPNFSSYSELGKSTEGKVLSFQSNNALTVQNSYIDFFEEIDAMIESVKYGRYRADGDNANQPRNVGMQNALSRIDHIMDHFEKLHTEVGASQRAMQYAYDRSNIIQLNVIETRSLIADTDMGEALMKFQQLQNNYSAMLSTTSKISQMSLLNYM